MQQSLEKKILTPIKLLALLLDSNYKQLECEDARQTLLDQKLLFSQEIAEMRTLAQKKKAALVDLQSLFLLRAQLRLKLEQLRKQRLAFETQMVCEVSNIKMTAVQIRYNSSTITGLDEIRGQNIKLNIKLKQMIDYGEKLEERVNLLSKQKGIISKPEEQKQRTIRMLSSIENYQDLDWRSKISLIKEEQKSLSLDFRQRFQARDKENQWKMKMQGQKLRTYISKSNATLFRDF